MTTTADGQSVIIVGGGAFGVAAALELRAREWIVTLIERGTCPDPRASSTDISKAIRVDYGADAFYTELAESALARWRIWNGEWDEPPFHADGFLLMTCREMAPGGFEGDGFALLSDRDYPVERVDGKTLRRRFPAWKSATFVDGYFNPQSGWAESSRCMAGLAFRARERGVRLLEQSHTSSLLERNGRVEGVVLDDGSRLESERVIVAAGAWTPHLVPGLEGRMQTTGQPVVHLRPVDPEPFRGDRFPVWGADISSTGYYGFPLSREGVVKIGHHGRGVAMHPNDPQEVGAERIERFRAFLSETFHGLGDAELVGSRLCLYCDTWDGNFWIDHHPQLDGLMVACGGSGHGFKFVPVLGEIVADVLERKPNRWAGRFAWREPQARVTEQARSLTD